MSRKSTLEDRQDVQWWRMRMIDWEGELRRFGDPAFNPPTSKDLCTLIAHGFGGVYPEISLTPARATARKMTREQGDDWRAFLTWVDQKYPLPPAEMNKLAREIKRDPFGPAAVNKLAKDLEALMHELDAGKSPEIHTGESFFKEQYRRRQLETAASKKDDLSWVPPMPGEESA